MSLGEDEGAVEVLTACSLGSSLANQNICEKRVFIRACTRDLSVRHTFIGFVSLIYCFSICTFIPSNACVGFYFVDIDQDRRVFDMS